MSPLYAVGASRKVIKPLRAQRYNKKNEIRKKKRKKITEDPHWTLPFAMPMRRRVNIAFPTKDHKIAKKHKKNAKLFGHVRKK